MLVEQLDELGCASTDVVLTPDECRSLVALYDDDTPLPLDRRHGPPPLRPGPVPLLRPTAARPRRPPARRVLAAPAAGGPERGPSGWAARRRGPTRSTSGSTAATRPARPDRPRCCCATGPATGTRCTATSTATSCSRCRSSIGLDRPGIDFTGGELLVVEQRPRSQSRGTALAIEQGHAVIVTTSERPLPSARGWSRAPVRHGVSVVRSGRRHTLGLLFHDAT